MWAVTKNKNKNRKKERKKERKKKKRKKINICLSLKNCALPPVPIYSAIVRLLVGLLPLALTRERCRVCCANGSCLFSFGHS